MSFPPSALSFPASVFAKVQPHAYLLAHLEQEPSSQGQKRKAPHPSARRRPNGRAVDEFRKPQINTGSLTHADGSAVVRAGDTAVVCGVRAEILRASDIPHPYRSSADDANEIEQLGLLVPNVELSTGCSPDHLPGNPPSTMAQSLSQRVMSLLHTSQIFDPNDLRILYNEPAEEVAAEEQEDESSARDKTVIKAYWTLYIDILLMTLDGSAFDTLWAAVLAALQDTRLPRAWWDADREVVICSDRVSEARPLSLRGLPVSASFAIFDAAEGEHGSEDDGKTDRYFVLADPDGFEEKLCDELVSVVVTPPSTRPRAGILKIEKHGGVHVDQAVLRQLVSSAQDHWKIWDAVFTPRPV